MQKTSSHFPNFDTSNAWQMGPNSQQVFFLSKNCSWALLPGSISLQMLITWSYQSRSKLQNRFCFLKTCWWLTGSSRLCDASQPPGSYSRYSKTILKIEVDRTLMHHISFSFDGISFYTRLKAPYWISNRANTIVRLPPTRFGWH